MELAALEKQLRTLQTESIAKIGAAETSAALEELGSSLLGKRGALTDLLRGIIHWHHKVFPYRGPHARIIEACRRA
ncbi:MAG: hypothetical protein RL715_648, partial [Chloroflexota bacterium]